MRSTDESYQLDQYHRLVIDDVSEDVDRYLSYSVGLEGAGGVVAVYDLDDIDISSFIELL